MYSMSNLGKLKTLDANAPAAMQAFWAFDKAASKYCLILGEFGNRKLGAQLPVARH